jgi:antitoxin component HigA of HigAB toxin-antitoxin module
MRSKNSTNSIINLHCYAAIDEIGLPATKMWMVAGVNCNQNDLARVVGLKSRASEILNRKRKLALEMIHQLNQVLGIPTDVLIQSY